MANDNIVDFAKRVKLVVDNKEDDALDPLIEVFHDKDIMDIFMTVLMFIRQTSLSETVSIKIVDDQIFIESKNFIDHINEAGVESATCLTKVGSMFIINDDGEEYPQETLVTDFQAMLDAIMKPMEDDEDEPKETD